MNVAVVGATGYAGRELVRWILGHPDLTLSAVQSTRHAGVPLASVLPELLGRTDIVLQPVGATDADAVFLAVPHGAAADIVGHYADVPVIIDLSADHRHAPGWVYGAPELCREAVLGAHRIAAPGCFATAMQLALGPLVAAGVVDGAVQISAQTGSTGSGAHASAATHHPDRFANLKAYKVLRHQHVPEVTALLDHLGTAPALHFVPTSAPVDRGIFATVFANVGDADARAILVDSYAGAPLIRLRASTPELRFVRGTAFADLAVHQDGAQAAVLVAIDNLCKGAATQAIQCLNLCSGFDDSRGLLHPGFQS